MKFLAHRGCWVKKEERNSLSALFEALDKGYGLETDVRDLDGRLVISHDMPTTQTAIPLDTLLRHQAGRGDTGTLGLNIKSDGLQELLQRQLKDHAIENYFVFDMSVPDTLGYLKRTMPTFVRRSELEHHGELTALAQGVWLDELLAPWIDASVIQAQAAEVPAVCIVSPELHGRPHLAQWTHILQALEAGCPSTKLLLCTDLPEEAERFFQ